MYLFVYGNFSDCPHDFEIVDGFSDHYALQNFYEFVGGYSGIDKEMFYDMTRNLPFHKAVKLFNALLPRYEIKKVFSGLNEVSIKDGDGNA